MFSSCVRFDPKARKTFFTKGWSQRAHFYISPPPGCLCGPYFKVTARTNHGNPAVPLLLSCYSPAILLLPWYSPAILALFFCVVLYAGLCAVRNTRCVIAVSAWWCASLIRRAALPAHSRGGGSVSRGGAPRDDDGRGRWRSERGEQEEQEARGAPEAHRRRTGGAAEARRRRSGGAATAQALSTPPSNRFGHCK